MAIGQPHTFTPSTPYIYAIDLLSSHDAFAYGWSPLILDQISSLPARGLEWLMRCLESFNSPFSLPLSWFLVSFPFTLPLVSGILSLLSVLFCQFLQYSLIFCFPFCFSVYPLRGFSNSLNVCPSLKQSPCLSISLLVYTSLIVPFTLPPTFLALVISSRPFQYILESEVGYEALPSHWKSG